MAGETAMRSLRPQRPLLLCIHHYLAPLSVRMRPAVCVPAFQPHVQPIAEMQLLAHENALRKRNNHTSRCKKNGAFIHKEAPAVLDDLLALRFAALSNLMLAVARKWHPCARKTPVPIALDEEELLGIYETQTT
jgi:hypothetical protein